MEIFFAIAPAGLVLVKGIAAVGAVHFAEEEGRAFDQLRGKEGTLVVEEVVGSHA